MAILLCLAALTFVEGAVGQYLYPGQVFTKSDIAFSFVGLAFVFAWYRIDARERSYPHSIGLNIAIVAVTIVAFPYYLFRSRGFRRGLIALGGAVVFCVAMQGLQMAGGYATYYSLQTE